MSAVNKLLYWFSSRIGINFTVWKWKVYSTTYVSDRGPMMQACLGAYYDIFFQFPYRGMESHMLAQQQNEKAATPKDIQGTEGIQYIT